MQPGLHPPSIVLCCHPLRGGHECLIHGRRHQRMLGGAEVLRSKDLNDLRLAVADDAAKTLAPFDGFIQRLRPNHGPAAQQFFQFDEWPIGHGEFPT